MAKTTGTIGNLDPSRSGTWQKRSHWHSLGAKLYPLRARAFDKDVPKLIRKHVLPGHTPEQPMLRAGDSVVTLGSCFARELRVYLKGAGFASDNLWIPSALNNSFALLDFVSWCVTGKETGGGYRYDRTADGEIRDWTPEEERERILGYLGDAGAYVLTLGLAEIWQDRETDGVFWRGIPNDVFDPERHVFRLSTVEENEQNVLRIIELIRRVNPGAPIVLTLSPVPLKATFREMSCMTADCVSKSTLRLALDRVIENRLPNIYYWPSFEIVRWVGSHRGSAAFGVDDGVSRHVARELVADIIDAFVEAFYTAEAVAELRANARKGQPSAEAAPAQ